MKNTSILAVTALAMAVGATTPARAGDREWAVAGKVLTGVVAAGVIAEAFRPAPPAPTTAIVYQTPPPTVVYAPPPPTVVYAPAPAVVYAPAPPPPPQVVYYYPAPAPVVVAAPVCYRPAVYYPGPAVSVSFGFGGHGGHGGHRHHGWR